MRQRTLAKLFLLCVLTTAIVALPSVVKAGKKEDKRIRKAQRTFEDIMDSRDTAIPRSLIRKASGIIILNQFKAGFVFGAKGGKGIVMAKDDRTQRWSPPAFLTVAEGSYGFQIGGQSIATVFLVMSIEKLDRILRGKFKIGVDASAAVGPVGRDAEAKLGAGAAMLTYSIAKGLYAGAAFEGGLLLADDGANEKMYGIKGISPQDILYRQKVKMPGSATLLIQLLQEYGGK